MSIGGTTEGASINLELGLSATANSSIGQSDFRGLAQVPTGQISLSDFYGKSNVIVVTPILATRTQYCLTPAEVPGYVAGQTKVQLQVGTLGSQTYLYSTSTSVPALCIEGFAAGDSVEIINYGYIIGKGGDGGKYYDGGFPTVNNPGQPGGPAISTDADLIITNNLYIAGGGGGGRSANGGVSEGYTAGGGGGGGAGGGRGGSFDGYALGGAPGMAGQDGFGGVGPYQPIGGAGGGRQLPGTGGAGTQVEGERYFTWQSLARGGGAGGGSGGNMAYIDAQEEYSDGVSGGSANNAGVNAPYWAGGGGGGGGWGASGGSGSTGSVSRPAQPGGAGGKAIVLNGKTAIISGPGTVYGAVS
jgi:hypothetical protein